MERKSRSNRWLCCHLHNLSIIAVCLCVGLGLLLDFSEQRVSYRESLARRENAVKFPIRCAARVIKQISVSPTAVKVELFIWACISK